MRPEIIQEFIGSINDVEINNSELYQAIVNDLTVAVDTGLISEEQSNDAELVVHLTDVYNNKWERQCFTSEEIERYFDDK